MSINSALCACYAIYDLLKGKNGTIRMEGRRDGVDGGKKKKRHPIRRVRMLCMTRLARIEKYKKAICREEEENRLWDERR